MEIQTALGALRIRLLADEAPRTAACFLEAVRLGVYRQTLIEDSRPGVWVRAGGDGLLATPPFTLPAEPATCPVRRGSLLVDVTRHPFRFCLARRAWPGLEAEGIVCGEVTEGFDVLDALLRGDRILDARPA